MQSSTPFLGFLALLCIVHFSEGQLPGGGALQCFDCDMEVYRGGTPLPCSRTRFCDAGKFCSVQVEEKGGGQVLRYKYGCDSFEKCSGRHLKGKELCMECCTTDGCNTRDNMCQPTDVASANIRKIKHEKEIFRLFTANVASANTQNRTGIFRLGGPLQCLDCDMEVNTGGTPLPCTRTRVCDAGKFCSVKVEVKEDGQKLRYRYGCESFEKCSSGRMGGKEACRECCTTDSCNTHDNLCPSIGVAVANAVNRTRVFSQGSGLQCFHCDGEIDIGEYVPKCSKSRVCDSDEYCRLQITPLNGKWEYNSGCAQITNCYSGTNGACNECCSTDGCNTQKNVCRLSLGIASANAVKGSGLQCFHCDGEIDIGEYVPKCLKSRVCDPYEYCRLQITPVNGKWEYHSGCDRITNCSSGTNGACNECCSTDGCNTQKHICRLSLGFASANAVKVSVLGQASSTTGISLTGGAAPSITTPQPIVYSSTSVSSAATSVIGSQSSTAAVRVTSASHQPKFSTVSSTAGANIKSTSTIPSTAKSSPLSDSQTTERPFSSTAGVDIKSTSTNPSTAKSSTLPDFTNTERSFSSTAGAAIRSTSANPSTAKSSTLPDFTTTDRTVRSTAESCRDAHICTGMKSADGSLDCQRPVMANLCKFSCGNCPAPAFSQASSTAHISSTEGAAPSITTPHTSAAVRETSAAQQPNFSTVSTTEGAAMTDFQTTEVHTCPSIIRQFSCDTDWVAELCLDECQI